MMKRKEYSPPCKDTILSGYYVVIVDKDDPEAPWATEVSDYYTALRYVEHITDDYTNRAGAAYILNLKTMLVEEL